MLTSLELLNLIFICIFVGLPIFVVVVVVYKNLNI